MADKLSRRAFFRRVPILAVAPLAAVAAATSNETHIKGQFNNSAITINGNGPVTISESTFRGNEPGIKINPTKELYG